MKVLCSTNPRELVIYRDRWGVMAFGLFIGLACLALGALFSFYVASESRQALFGYFGWGFMIVGLLILSSLPRQFRRTHDEKGFPILRVTHDSITCSPQIGPVKTTYRWNQIRKLVVAERLVHSDADGRTEDRNAIVLVFRENEVETGFLENARHQRHRAPTGELYSHVPFPRNLSPSGLEFRLRKFLPKGVELQVARRFALLNE